MLVALASCSHGNGTLPPRAQLASTENASVSTIQTDWLQFGYDEQRDAYNPVETLLSTTSVPSIKQKWSAQLESAGAIFAQPLLVHAVNVQGTMHSVLYATSFYHLTAIDSVASTSTAKILWSRTLPSTTTSCAGGTVHNGTWATPYIDLAAQRIYIADGARNFDAFTLSGGTLLYSKPVVSYVNGGITGAVSLELSTHTAYVATTLRCGYEKDATTPMRGTVVSFAASTGAPLSTFTTVTTPGYYGGGIWGMGGVSIDPSTKNVFAASGNSWPTSTTSGQHIDYAEHVISLTPALKVIGANSPGVSNADDDFGATPVLFRPTGCSLMAAVSNKNGELYFYNAASIASGPFARVQMANPVPGDFNNGPAFDASTQMLYETSSTDTAAGVVPAYKHGLTAFSFRSCRPMVAFNVAEGTAAPTSTTSPDDNYSSPTVANGVVYFGAGSTNRYYANDARTGALRWTSPLLAGKAQISPMVVNGRLYVVAGGWIYAYGL